MSSEVDTADTGVVGELLTSVPSREQIVKLEHFIAENLPLMEIEPVHHFADGIYARELRIPAGTVLTGKVHKTEHLNILSQGKITVWTEEGMKTVEAPYTIVSKPGTKRAGYAHTDCVWTTIHGTALRDLDELEAALIEFEPHLQPLLESAKKPLLEE